MYLIRKGFTNIKFIKLCNHIWICKVKYSNLLLTSILWLHNKCMIWLVVIRLKIFTHIQYINCHFKTSNINAFLQHQCYQRYLKIFDVTSTCIMLYLYLKLLRETCAYICGLWGTCHDQNGILKLSYKPWGILLSMLWNQKMK